MANIGKLKLANTAIPIFGRSGYIDPMGNRIKELRKERGLSLEALAHKASAFRQEEVDLTTIHKLEKGRQKLTVEWMEIIAPALDVKPADLLEASSPAHHPTAETEEVRIKASFLALKSVLARLDKDLTPEDESDLLLTAYRFRTGNPTGDLEKDMAFYLARNPLKIREKP